MNAVSVTSNETMPSRPNMMRNPLRTAKTERMTSGAVMVLGDSPWQCWVLAPSSPMKVMNHMRNM